MALKIITIMREQYVKVLADVPDTWAGREAYKLPAPKVLNGSNVDWEQEDIYIDNVEDVPANLSADELFDLDCERTGENGEPVKLTDADMYQKRNTVED